MKAKKIETKLVLNKETVADLDKRDMKLIKGGGTSLDMACGSNCICMI